MRLHFIPTHLCRAYGVHIHQAVSVELTRTLDRIQVCALRTNAPARVRLRTHSHTIKNDVRKHVKRGFGGIVEISKLYNLFIGVSERTSFTMQLD